MSYAPLTAIVPLDEVSRLINERKRDLPRMCSLSLSDRIDKDTGTIRRNFQQLGWQTVGHVTADGDYSTECQPAVRSNSYLN